MIVNVHNLDYLGSDEARIAASVPDVTDLCLAVKLKAHRKNDLVEIVLNGVDHMIRASREIHADYVAGGCCQSNGVWSRSSGPLPRLTRNTEANGYQSGHEPNGIVRLTAVST